MGVVGGTLGSRGVVSLGRIIGGVEMLVVESIMRTSTVCVPGGTENLDSVCNIVKGAITEVKVKRSWFPPAYRHVFPARRRL